MKIDTTAFNHCYELMGRLSPDHWDIDNDGAVLTVKLRTMSSGQMYLQFKGDTIRICNINCMGKLIGSDTITNKFISPDELREHLIEIWGDEVYIPPFNRKLLK